jgi:hypothetical protein
MDFCFLKSGGDPTCLLAFLKHGNQRQFESRADGEEKK